MRQPQKITQADRIFFDFQRTGRVNAIFSQVCRSLGALTRETDVSRFKIGKTNDPLGRYKREYGRDYAELLVLYRTRSRHAAAEMESRLIERNCDFHRCKNWAGGGGGHVGESGPYFVYVVVGFRRKPKRISKPRNGQDELIGAVRAIRRMLNL